MVTLTREPLTRKDSQQDLPAALSQLGIAPFRLIEVERYKQEKVAEPAATVRRKVASQVAQNVTLVVAVAAMAFVLAVVLCKVGVDGSSLSVGGTGAGRVAVAAFIATLRELAHKPFAQVVVEVIWRTGGAALLVGFFSFAWFWLTRPTPIWIRKTFVAKNHLWRTPESTIQMIAAISKLRPSARFFIETLRVEGRTAADSLLVVVDSASHDYYLEAWDGGQVYQQMAAETNVKLGPSSERDAVSERSSKQDYQEKRAT